MIYDLIAFGGVIFWMIVAAAVIIAALFVGNDDNGWPATVVLAVIAVFLLAFSALPGNSLSAFDILCIIGGYLLIGAAWALLKWNAFLNKVLAAVQAGMTRGKLVYEFNVRTYPPAPTDQADRIATWFFYWPLSILGWVISGPVAAIYDALTGVMDHMSASKFKGVTPHDGH